MSIKLMVCEVSFKIFGNLPKTTTNFGKKKNI